MSLYNGSVGDYNIGATRCAHAHAWPPIQESIIRSHHNMCGFLCSQDFYMSSKGNVRDMTILLSTTLLIAHAGGQIAL